MANPEHLSILKRGVEVWNDWRNVNYSLEPDLSGADLRDLTFELDLILTTETAPEQAFALEGFGGTLRGINFANVLLTRADLSRSIFTGADFEGADLREAQMYRTAFRSGTLRNARLQNSNLRETVFAGCDLQGVDFAGAHVDQTVFSGVDLSRSSGLDEVIHRSVPAMTLDTLLLSRAKIPPSWLARMGIPHHCLADLASVFERSASGQDLASCFISYSHVDEAFAATLHRDLRSHGVRCWFAPHDVKGGKPLHEQITRAIQDHDRVLLILSEKSMQSDWVKTEVLKARSMEVKTCRSVLFPIRLVDYRAISRWECFDADTGEDVARCVRQYFVPDFSSWSEPESYGNAFLRLLNDLRRDLDPTGF